MKTIRRFAAYAALPLMLASSFQANAAYVAVDSFTSGSVDMDFEAAGEDTQYPASGWWTTDATVWAYSTEQTSTGTGSVRCGGTDVGDSRIQATVQIPNAGTFKLSFDVYIDSSVSNEGLSSISAIFATPWYDQAVDLSTIAKDEWVTVETAAFTYDAATSTELWMRLYSPAGDILFYMDNLQLLEYVEDTTTGGGDDTGDTETEALENLITNSSMAGFEIEGTVSEGGASGWWTQSSAIWQRSTDQAANGSTASMLCSVDVTDLTSDGAFIQNSGTNPIAIASAGKYKLSFYVYVDGTANETLDHLNIIMKGTDTWLDATIDLSSVEKDTWTLVEHEYEFATALASCEMWIRMNADGATSGSVLFYIDDMVLGLVEAVDGIAATDNATVAVAARNGEIVIAGATDGAQVTVYSVTGAVVANTVSTTGSVSIPATSGIYIVKVGNKVTKVSL